MRGVLGLAQNLLRGGDERLAILGFGVKRRQSGQGIRLLRLDLDHSFEGANRLLGVLQAVAVQASDLQRPLDSLFGIGGEAELPFRHARHARPIVASLGHSTQGLVCLHARGIEIADDVLQRADRLGRIVQLLDQQVGALERQGNRLGGIAQQCNTPGQQVSQPTPVRLRRRDGGQRLQSLAIGGQDLEQVLPRLLRARNLLESITGEAS